MSEVLTWDTSAANNNSAPPDGAPENMNYSDVNNVIRENMAAIARHVQDTNGSLTTGGSANAITITPNATYASYTQGMRISFTAGLTNTGATTLKVGSLAAVELRGYDDAALSGGEIVAGRVYDVVYNGSRFNFVNPELALNFVPSTGGTFTGNVGFGGETSPAVAVEISGAAAATEVLRLSNEADSARTHFYPGLIESQNTALILDAADGNGVFIYNSGAEVARFNSTRAAFSENVYIGGSALPAAPLHVNGGTTDITARFESTDGNAFIAFVDNTTPASDEVLIGAVGSNFVIHASNVQQAVFTGTQMGLNGATQNASLNVAPSSAGGQVFSLQRDTFDRPMSLNAPTGTDNPWTWNTANAILWQVDSTNTLWIGPTAGRVGINTAAAPAVNLQVEGDDPRIRLHDTDTALSDGETAGGIEFYQSDASGAGVGASIVAVGNGSTGLLDLVFYAGANNEALRIRQDGNVGINVADPVATLHIAEDAGSTRIDIQARGGTDTHETASLQMDTSGNFGVQFRNNVGVFLANAYIIQSDAGGVVDHVWYTGGTAEKMRLSENGDLTLVGNLNVELSAGDINIKSTGGGTHNLRMTPSGNDVYIQALSGDLVLDADGDHGAGNGSRFQMRRNGSTAEILFRGQSGDDCAFYMGDTADTIRVGFSLDTSANALVFRGYNNVARAYVNTDHFNFATDTAAYPVRFSRSTGDNEYLSIGVDDNKGTWTMRQDENSSQIRWDVVRNAGTTDDTETMTLINNSSGWNLTLTGGDMNAVDFNATSDEREKYDIEDWSGGLDIVRQINVKSFKRNGRSDHTHIGVIAQQILPFLPEAIRHNEETDRLQLILSTMVGVILSALQDLDGEVQQLKAA